MSSPDDTVTLDVTVRFSLKVKRGYFEPGATPEQMAAVEQDNMNEDAGLLLDYMSGNRLEIQVVPAKATHAPLMHCTQAHPMPEQRDQMGQVWLHHDATPVVIDGCTFQTVLGTLHRCPHCKVEFSQPTLDDFRRTP